MLRIVEGHTNKALSVMYTASAAMKLSLIHIYWVIHGQGATNTDDILLYDGLLFPSIFARIV